MLLHLVSPTVRFVKQIVQLKRELLSLNKADFWCEIFRAGAAVCPESRMLQPLLSHYNINILPQLGCFGEKRGEKKQSVQSKGFWCTWPSAAAVWVHISKFKKPETECHLFCRTAQLGWGLRIRLQQPCISGTLFSCLVHEILLLLCAEVSCADGFGVGKTGPWLSMTCTFVHTHLDAHSKSTGVKAEWVSGSRSCWMLKVLFNK